VKDGEDGLLELRILIRLGFSAVLIPNFEELKESHQRQYSKTNGILTVFF
jgi:hypothetical protein